MLLLLKNICTTTELLSVAISKTTSNYITDALDHWSSFMSDSIGYNNSLLENNSITVEFNSEISSIIVGLEKQKNENNWSITKYLEEINKIFTKYLKHVEEHIELIKESLTTLTTSSELDNLNTGLLDIFNHSKIFNTLLKYELCAYMLQYDTILINSSNIIDVFNVINETYLIVLDESNRSKVKELEETNNKNFTTILETKEGIKRIIEQIN